MFCYQCEQTDRTDSPDRPNLLSFGCSAAKGNCGKDATTAALQDVLVYVNLGIGQYAQKAREFGAPDPAFAAHASFDLFTTLTNVNFNATRFMALIADAVAIRESAKLAYENAARAAGVEPEAPERPGPIRAGDNDFRCGRPRAHRRRRRRAGNPRGRRGRSAQPQPVRPQGCLRLRPPCARARLPHRRDRCGYRVGAGVPGRRPGRRRRPAGPRPRPRCAELRGDGDARRRPTPAASAARCPPRCGSPRWPARPSWSPATTCTTWPGSWRPPRAPASTSTPTASCCPPTATPNCTSTATSPGTTAAPGRTSSAISPPSPARS